MYSHEIFTVGQEKSECRSHCWNCVRSLPSGVHSFMVVLAAVMFQGESSVV